MAVGAMTIDRLTTMVAVAAVLAALVGLPAAAQTSNPVKGEDLVGVWDGSATTSHGALPLRIELAYAGGKFSGAVDSPMGRLPIVDGTLSADTLTLNIEMEGAAIVLSGKVQGSTIEGSWAMSGDGGTYSVARAAADGAKSGSPAGTADPISGDWTGEVLIGGQSMPFTLSLKLSGESVTGEIASSAGTVPLSGGWKDGTLQVSFLYVGGEPVSMGGQVQEGKLSGVIDYNKGEMQGNWSAARK